MWTDEDFPFILTNKATDFIEKNKTNPFFLFYSYHDIHAPRLPHKQFQGKSNMGSRGDVIAQMDWCTGEIMKKLKADGRPRKLFDAHGLFLFVTQGTDGAPKGGPKVLRSTRKRSCQDLKVPVSGSTRGSRGEPVAHHSNCRLRATTVLDACASIVERREQTRQGEDTTCRLPKNACPQRA